MLKGENIHKKIGNATILSGVTIEVPKGEIRCIIGPSGSGKSSILSCLSLLSYPDNGIVTVDDKQFSFANNHEDYSDFPYPDVTIVFQGLFLWPHLTNKDNLLLPLKGKKYSDDEFNRITSLLNIQHLLNKYPNDCSGGEKQRIALARQLLLKPKYLLLDEVTSALDLEQVNVVANILKELKAELTGVLLVTHMINFAKSIGDYFYFIDEGKIAEEGKIEKLSKPDSDRLNRFLQIYT
jgi:ABC-type polar amino acid transport system ATPase subunit